MTPSTSCSKRINSVANASVPGASASACRRSTGSRSSCAHRQCFAALGNSPSGCDRFSTRRSISRPASDSAQMRKRVRSIGRPAARISSSTPHWRKISIVRMLMLRALGCSAVPACRSTRREGTPRRESRIEALRPTGPPPTISTGTSIINRPQPGVQVAPTRKLPVSDESIQGATHRGGKPLTTWQSQSRVSRHETCCWLFRPIRFARCRSSRCPARRNALRHCHVPPLHRLRPVRAQR